MDSEDTKIISWLAVLVILTPIAAEIGKRWGAKTREWLDKYSDK